MPAAVQPKGSHVGVPTTARALKDLVAARNRASINHRTVSLVGITIIWFNRAHYRLGAWQDGRSRSARPCERLLRQLEIHTAGSQHPAFRRRRFESMGTQSRSIEDA